MTPKKTRFWQMLLLLVGAAVAMVGVWGYENAYAALVGMGLVLLSAVVWWVFYRCPQCHEQLGRENPQYCPHCGAWLSDEPEPEPEKKKIQHKKKRR